MHSKGKSDTRKDHDHIFVLEYHVPTLSPKKWKWWLVQIEEAMVKRMANISIAIYK